jgi:hypothetical protein
MERQTESLRAWPFWSGPFLALSLPEPLYVPYQSGRFVLVGALVSRLTLVKIRFILGCCSSQVATQADRVNRAVSVSAVVKLGAILAFHVRWLICLNRHNQPYLTFGQPHFGWLPKSFLPAAYHQTMAHLSDWHVFDPNDRKTYPKVDAPVQVRFDQWSDAQWNRQAYV